MLQRVLTAVVLIPPVIYLIGWSPKWVFLVALVVTAEVGLFEFFAMSRQAGVKAYPVAGYLAGAAVCVIPALQPRQPELSLLLLLVLLVLLAPSLALGLTPDLKDYLAAAATTIFGTVYVGLTLSCLVPLRFSEPPMGGTWLTSPATPHSAVGRNLLLLLFLVIWAGDIAALFVGRALGRRPFFPHISPKKTVEGAVGGLAGSVLVGWVFARWWWQTANVWPVMLLTLLIALSGQVGDLVESALKRGASMKDSGTLLPGHGGLLDRIDSLLFGAPALWLALTVKDLWV